MYSESRCDGIRRERFVFNILIRSDDQQIASFQSPKSDMQNMNIPSDIITVVLSSSVTIECTAFILTT